MMLIHAALLWLSVAAAGSVADDPTTRKKVGVKKRLAVLEARARDTTAHLDWADDHKDFTEWVGDNQFDEEPFTTYLTEEWFRNLGDKLSGIQDTLQNVQNDVRSIDGRVTRIEDSSPANVTDVLHMMDTRLSGTEVITDQLQCSASKRLEVCVPREWVTVVVGGWTGSADTDAVQMFGGDFSRVLPNIKFDISSSRMIALGSKLYSCGGALSGWVATDSVFSLDLSKEDSTWQTLHPLPRASFEHHISGANGVIMAIYEDGSLSITNGSESASYEGVFDHGTINWRSCLAHNATHSFFLHGGIVYMNNDAMNPTDWEKIAEIDLGSNNVGTACLLFESELFVTRLDKLFIMNTDTFAVKEGASPYTPRWYHGMGVINDRVAVLGGYINDGGKHTYFDSIETYDRQNNMWQEVEKLWQPMRGIGIVSVLY